MRKCIAVLLCACSLYILTMTAFASEAEPDYIAEYEAIYGKMPVSDDFPSSEEYQAAYDIWLAGFQPYVDMRFAEWSQEKAKAEDAAHAAEEEISGLDEAPPEIDESVGSNHDVFSDPPPASADTGVSDKYPVGSYVSSAGNVYSSSGELLSPGTTPAVDPFDPVSSSSVLQDALDVSEDVLPEDQEPVYTLSDLRAGGDPAASAPVGLKALVISIFGEYVPVTTTSVVSETVGNEVDQYLVETVAPGAAGVDYEWIAGVFLFGILLFCLMKLLGGVLK